MLNTNYADLSFLFTIDQGRQWNSHLNSEYLAVLETDHSTPYYVNLHDQDVAHILILGYTGSGKSFLLNFLIQNLQKYEPLTFIFDLGGSYESLTHIFAGSYLNVGLESQTFTINPFCLKPTRENLNFLYLFARVLIEGNARYELTGQDEKALYAGIERVYNGTKPDILLLLGMLMLGMALGALLTLIRQKAITAKIIQELEAKFRVQEETPHERGKDDSTKPDAA